MEQLINDYGQLILGAVGVLLLFFAGNKDKAWEALKGLLSYFPGQKQEEPKSAESPLEVKKDELSLPPVKVEIPLDTRQKIDWPEVKARLQDGVQFVDVIFFARILLALLQFIRPFLIQTADEEIAKQEMKK